MSIQDLTESQQEALANFQAITQEFDLETSLSFLTKNYWDLEAASNIYISQGRDFYKSPPAFQTSFLPQRLPQEQDQKSQAQLEIPNPPSRLWAIPRFLGSGIYWIGSSVFSVFRSALGYIYYPQERQEQPPPVNLSHRLPNYLSMNFSQALQKAKMHNKPLLAILINNSTSQEYIENTICGEVSTAFMNEYYLVWAGDSQTASRLMQAQIFPCVSVFKVQQTNQPIMIEKQEGQISIESMAEFLDRCFSHFEMMTPSPYLAETRIRERQDREFQEAERQAYELQRLEAQKQQTLKREKEAQELARMENLRKLQEKKMKIGIEPDIGDQVVQLSIRLPSGQKIDRRFTKDSTVGFLKQYVDTLDLGVEYEIVTSFPARVLDNDENTLEFEGLFPRALVHIREPMLNN